MAGVLSLPSKFFSSRVGQTKGKVGAPSVGGGDTDEDEDEDGNGNDDDDEGGEMVEVSAADGGRPSPTSEMFQRLR